VDAEKQGAKVAVLDIPLLYETAGEARCDAVVVVSAPADTQRARLKERGISDERFEAIVVRQVPDAVKREKADFIVDSGQGFEHARAQVREILRAVATMPKRRR
jgi:dephospho-CoA kinase